VAVLFLCYRSKPLTQYFAAMAGKFDRDTLNAIEKVAEIFGLETVRTLTARLTREGLINTRGLIRSLDYQTQTDLGRVVHTISFAFQNYGRFQDMKKVRYGEQPPIDKILDWVEAKGLAAFGTDPNPYKRKKKTDERRRNEIAWGIARSLQIDPRYRKRRKWFNSEFYKNLAALQEELILATGDVLLEDMKASLLNRLQTGPTTQIF
jgi:hypothetical protein